MPNLLLDELCSLRQAQATSSRRTALPLITTDADGWPRVALLSLAELIGAGSDVILSPYEGTRTTANLLRARRALLVVVTGAGITKARLEVVWTGKPVEVPGMDARITPVRCRIVATDHDATPYADIVSSIEFELHDDVSTTRRWEAQQRILRSFATEATP